MNFAQGVSQKKKSEPSLPYCTSPFMPTQSAAKTTMGSQIKQKENLNWKINLLAAQVR
jgi:hypothetical protein